MPPVPGPLPCCRSVVLGQFNVTTLDTFFGPFLDYFQGRVAMVKIDVESFEDRVGGMVQGRAGRFGRW